MTELSEKAKDREEPGSSPVDGTGRAIVIGLLGLLAVSAGLMIYGLRPGDKPKERNYCTERSGRRTIYLVKEKYPEDRYDITCDPKTGIVTATEKQPDAGSDGGTR